MREVVVMHRHRPGKLCARARKQIRPLLGIELRRGEQRDDVLVAEGVLVAELLLVVREDGVVGQIHFTTIPLAALRRVLAADRDRPPVRVDAELGVAEPLRVLVRFERGPIGLEGTCGNKLVYAPSRLLDFGGLRRHRCGELGAKMGSDDEADDTQYSAVHDPHMPNRTPLCPDLPQEPSAGIHSETQLPSVVRPSRNTSWHQLHPGPLRGDIRLSPSPLSFDALPELTFAQGSSLSCLDLLVSAFGLFDLGRNPAMPTANRSFASEGLVREIASRMRGRLEV